MPANPYPTIATNLTTEESNIIASWGFAETELQSQGAPATEFLEIRWDGGSSIVRVFDGSAVSSLLQSEQLRLYPQLGGLFNLAMRNLLY
jgi:hypothetical protein